MGLDEEWDEEEEETNHQTSSVANSNQSNNFLPLLLNLLLRKGWLIVLFAIAGVMLALLASRRDPPTYVGKFEILVEPVTSEEKRTDASVLANGAKKSDESLTELDYPTQLRILTSPAMMQSIADKLHQQAKKLDKSAILRDLTKNLIIQRVQQGKSRFDYTKIIEVTYEGTNAKWVQLVLGTTATRFVEYSQLERKENLDAGIQFIDRQLQRLKKQINTLQDQQEIIQKNNDLIDPQAKGTELSTHIIEIQQKKQRLTAQLQDLQEIAIHLEKTLGFNSQQASIAIILSQDSERQNLLAQLQKIDSEIALQSGFYRANSPQIQDLNDLRQNISQLLEQKTLSILRQQNISASPVPSTLKFQDISRQKQIQELVTTQNQIDSIQRQLVELSRVERQVSSNFQKIPSLIKGYQELDRQLALNINLVDQLSAQRESLQVEKAQNKTPWQIISPPALPRNAKGEAIAFPPNPKKKLIVGAMGGLVLGLLLAYGIERLQNKVFSISELELLSSFPVMARISGLTINSTPETQSSPSSQSLMSLVDAISPSLSELYLNLHFRHQNPPIRTLLLLSVDSEPMQSAIAVSLARTAASTRKPILLVDANKDHPEIHDFFDFPLAPGLLNILFSPTQVLSTIQKTSAEPYLGILPLGSQESSSNSVISAQLPKLKAIFAEHYDLIIINAPVFVNSIEANLLAEQVDGMMMIIHHRNISLSRFQTIMQQIRSYNLPLLGFIELSD